MLRVAWLVSTLGIIGLSGAPPGERFGPLAGGDPSFPGIDDLRTEPPAGDRADRSSPSTAGPSTDPAQTQPVLGRFEKCTYTSRLDGATIEYALWFPPQYDPAQRWPLIVFLHGSAEGKNTMSPTSDSASIPVRGAKWDLPFVVVFPLMRGTWSITSLAEVDVLDTVADVQARASIDPDRIHLTGLSLGGFAAWRLACRYPDRFATVSAFCGGGQPDLAVNLRNLPTRVYHGTADKHVHVRESRVMVQAMRDAGLDPYFTELRDVGHSCWRQPYAGNALYEWMAKYRRAAAPRRISYRTRTLRHHQAYWVSIESMIDPGQPAYVDVFAPDQPGASSGGEPGSRDIFVHAENVARLRLAPPESVLPKNATPTVFADEQPIETKRADGAERGWVVDLIPNEAPPASTESGGSALAKRPGLSGPIQDVYYDPFLVVVPAAGSSPAAETWRHVADKALAWADRLVFKNIHPVTDVELTAEMIADHHLICFGDAASNRVIAQASAPSNRGTIALPLSWVEGRLHVDGQPGAEDVAGFVMIYPNPFNPQRYIVVCSGLPQAVLPLATLVLRPPYLEPIPVEDVVVITRSGQFPLASAAGTPGDDTSSSHPPDSADDRRLMGDPRPPHGAVFDRFWQIPPPVKARLLGADE